MPQGGNVPYNPVATVSPSGGGDSGYIGSQASPAAFGGQVAQAEQGLGSSLEKVGAVGMDIATEQQGRINQSLADNAWTQHTTDVNDITAKYRSMEGLDAVQAHDATVAAITASRQKIAASLPNTASQMAFNTMARRQEAAALGEVSSYYATAVKQASLKSSNAVMQTATNQTGLLPVAQSDGQFAHSVTTATLSLNDQMTTQGYGAGISVDPKTGVASWDTSTPGGKQAQAIYQQKYDTLQSQAWTNRIKTLADDPTSGSPQIALQVFNANKDKIPAQAQMELQAYLQPKLRTLDAHAAAGAALDNADRGYQTLISGTHDMGGVVDRMIYNESGGQAGAKASTSSATGPGQFIDSTWLNMVKQTRPDLAQGQTDAQILAMRSNKSLSRDMVTAYAQQNSTALEGAGLLATPTNIYLAHGFGAAGAIKLLKADPSTSMSSLVTPDVLQANPQYQGKTAGQVIGMFSNKMADTPNLITKADYYRQNESQIVDDARNEALARHPDDDAGADLAAARAQQQTGAVIRQQDNAYKADSDLVFQAVNGTLSKGQAPLTTDQLRAVSPEVASAWDRLQYQQPQQAREISTKLLPENARTNGGTDPTLGGAYWDTFRRVNLPAGDPNRITSVDQVYSLAGKADGLSREGLKAIADELKGKNTPDGEAESKMRDQMFRNVRGNLTGTNDGLGIKDPQGEAIFLHFMAAAYPAIEKAKAAGKSAYQIYDPSSPDYVGKLAAGMKRSPAQYQSDMNNNYQTAAGSILDGKVDLTNRDSIVSAYRSGKLSRADAAKALVDGGFAAAARPAAPAPAAALPLAQQDVPTNG